MNWDHEVDVLVVGSGNGAMTAAICSHDMLGEGAKTLLIEKSFCFGGTSGLSGGGVWVPNNRYAKAAGANDSFEEAFEYLDNTVPEELVDRELLRTYLKQAPKMVDYLHEHTHVRYQSLAKYPDYYSDLPGSKTGHRSMEPTPVSYSKLGKDRELLIENGVLYMFYKYAITQVEAQKMVEKTLGWQLIPIKLLLQFYLDIPWLLFGKKGISRRTTGGLAGIIRLYLSLKERNIPLWLNTAFEELIMEDGKVVGAVIKQQGKTLRVKTNKAVILAAGGFEHNQQMREQYLPKPTSTEWSAACKTNTGDAHRAAEKANAKLAQMNGAWWCTTKVIPNAPYPFLSIINKSLPGSIVVNMAGKRFSNESQNYMAFQQELFAKHTEQESCVPCYMVFDSEFRHRRNVWPLVLPDAMLSEAYFEEKFLGKAESIEELALQLGIDAAELVKTVEKFNAYARNGKDEDFNRGDAAYDRYYGDPKNIPNPCLGEILKPPFWAVRLNPGDFGTQGGMQTNSYAQVLDNNEQAIEGLYACGNCSAAVLPTYPGPGSTLGPAMTFAYIAACHIAGKTT